MGMAMNNMKTLAFIVQSILAGLAGFSINGIVMRIVGIIPSDDIAFPIVSLLLALLGLGYTSYARANKKKQTCKSAIDNCDVL